MNNMTPQYSTLTFKQVFDSVAIFKSDLANSGFPALLKDANQSVLYYLLYARYGNTPIGNRDINQWKTKVFAIIFQYGPTWERKLEIQESLRGLTDEDLITGSKAIRNYANNPDSEPGTSTLHELPYINAQSTNTEKRSKLSGYAILWELLQNDVTEDFIKRFASLFKMFAQPENPLLFIDEEE